MYTSFTDLRLLGNSSHWAPFTLVGKLQYFWLGGYKSFKKLSSPCKFHSNLSHSFFWLFNLHFQFQNFGLPFHKSNITCYSISVFFFFLFFTFIWSLMWVHILICPVVRQTYCFLMYINCTNLKKHCSRVIPLQGFLGHYKFKVCAKFLCVFSHRKDFSTLPVRIKKKKSK